jgi:hypothetical protein
VRYQVNERGFLPAEPDAALPDPAIEPSFLGIVLPLNEGEEGLKHAFSFAFINSLNASLGWISTTERLSEQSFNRFRLCYAADLILSEETEGWFPHMAFGIGLDWGSSNFEVPNRDAEFTESGIAFGLGILVTIYEGGEDFSIDLGVSFSSEMDYDFEAWDGVAPYPALNWPSSTSIGVAVYTGRLKVTADVQIADWDGASADSEIAGYSSFEETTSFSVGFEYTVPLSEELIGFIRGGYRLFDAPWDDVDLIPFAPSEVVQVAVGEYRLSIDSDGEDFGIFTTGFGVYWESKEGKMRGFDFGVELGGDRVTFAIGYMQEL